MATRFSDQLLGGPSAFLGHPSFFRVGEAKVRNSKVSGDAEIDGPKIDSVDLGEVFQFRSPMGVPFFSVDFWILWDSGVRPLWLASQPLALSPKDSLARTAMRSSSPAGVTDEKANS